MGIDYKKGIVRILDQEKETVGTGFVLTKDGLIVTCAHVIEDAGGQPGHSISLVFYATQERLQPRDKLDTAAEATLEAEPVDLYDSQIVRQAKVLPMYFRSKYAEDVAILCLEGELPEDVLPLPCIPSYNTKGQTVETFGFPKDKDVEGLNARITILDLGTENKYPVLQLSSFQLSRGFSGAPIWDEKRSGVIGMATSIIGTKAAKLDSKTVINVPSNPDNRQQETAFATPIETIRTIYPILLQEECPYLGLSPFSRNQARFFFGRKQVIDALVERLRNDLRFLAVFGPSGSGKTSLVQAGLIPRLEEGELPGSRDWSFLIMRPLDDPFQQVTELGLNETDDPIEKVRDRLKGSKKTRLVLIIDQFEELFVKCTDAMRQKFLQQVDRLLEASSLFPITIVVVMRDDFYSYFVQEETLVKWLNPRLVNVPSTLQHAEVVDIVCKPAEEVSLQLGDDLVELIVKDVMETTASSGKGSAGRSAVRSIVLPLLEFTLTQLWNERQESGILSSATYTKIGGVSKSLVNWATQTFNDFELQERPTVRRIFTDLVYLGDESQGRPHVRQRLPLNALYSDDDTQREMTLGIIETLVEKRLLARSREEKFNEKGEKVGQEVMVEIVHEVLLREWSDLRIWLEDDRKFLLWRQRLRERIEDWQKLRAGFSEPDELEGEDSIRAAEYKLLEGPDLNKALEYLATHSGRLTQQDKDFIEASEEKRRREEAQEHEQVMRERALQRQARNWRRYLVAAVFVFLVAMVILAPVLLSIRSQADQQAQAALANQAFAKSADARAHYDSDKALLFGVEAARIENTYEIRSGLVEKLQESRSILATLYSHIFHNFNSQVSDIQFSSDGRTFFSSGTDGRIQKWNVSTRRLALPSFTLAPYYNPFSSDYNSSTSKVQASGIAQLALSSDGKLLASLGTGGLWLWDAATGKSLGQLADAQSGYTSIAFSPDGALLAAGNAGSRRQNTYLQPHIALWNVDSGLPRSLPAIEDTGQVLCVAFSPDSTLLASGGPDRAVHLWNMQTKQSAGRTLKADQGSVTALAFSRDGHFLASGDGSGTVFIWNMLSGERLIQYRTYYSHDAVTRIAFSPDEKKLASVIGSSFLEVWNIDLRGGHLIDDSHFSGLASALSFNPDGNLLATGDENKIKFWNMSSENPLSAVNQLSSSPPDWSSSALSPKGEKVAVGLHGKILVWNVSGGLLRALSGSANTDFSHLVFSLDGRLLAAIGPQESVNVWDVQSGQLVGGVDLSGEVLTSLAFSPDGNWLAISGGDRDEGHHVSIALWDVPHQTLLRKVTISSLYVNSLAFSLDGNLLALGGKSSAGSAVQLWDVTTGKLTGKTSNSYRGKTVTKVVFSQDGRFLGAVDDQGGYDVWDIKSGTSYINWYIGGVAHDIAFSPDGTTLATLDTIQTLSLEDMTKQYAKTVHLSNGSEENQIQNGDQRQNMVFSPNGQIVVLKYNHDTKMGSIEIWDGSLSFWIARACSIVGRNFTYAEWREWHDISNQPYSKVCPLLPVDQSQIEGIEDVDYVQATQWAVQSDDAILNDQICRHGSFAHQVWDVLPACDRAIFLDPSNGDYHDDRGLARALSGDNQGAIEDFRYFERWSAENNLYTKNTTYKKERDTWVAELQVGHNPFDEALLRSLQNHWPLLWPDSPLY